MGGLAIHRSIPLSQGRVCWVDQSDYQMLRAFCWSYSRSATSVGYASRMATCGGKKCGLSMHRMIMLPDPGQQVDHINLNGLDNRRKNLRLCTPSQNHANRRRDGNPRSRYRGVAWLRRDSKWKAQVKRDHKCVNLGHFHDEVAAALAYDVAALSVFGEFAWPNFLRLEGMPV